MSAVKKHEDNIVQFNKGKKMADKFEKGYVMSSRLYRYEVRPFLSDAAKNVYAELEDRINGFKDKITDHVSYSQLQGFLNGVCRHEHWLLQHWRPQHFLNGVCRHEPKNQCV